MSSFLRTAKPGDVRIVVYTGHADRFFHEDRPSIVPPACASPEQAISAQCWEDTVRRNSTPGAIVLSVFACCYAGGFMQQKSSLLNMDEGIFFSHWTKGRHEAPTFLTLSSSTALGPSYESMGHQSDGVGDHFLHAINVAVRSRQVNGWEDFARALEFHFMEARTSGFLGDAENNLHEELISYPQEPVLTASGLPVYRPLTLCFHAYPQPLMNQCKFKRLKLVQVWVAVLATGVLVQYWTFSISTTQQNEFLLPVLPTSGVLSDGHRMGEQIHATTTKEDFDVEATDRSATSGSRNHDKHTSPRVMSAWKSRFGLARTHARHNHTLSIENAFFLMNRGLAAAGLSHESLPTTTLHDRAAQLPTEKIANANSGNFISSTTSHSGSTEDSDEYFFTPRSTIELPAR
ncbi:hypothetical protein BDV93DRAFT_516961, partial [Ceratobasidium sp. AG-I]